MEKITRENIDTLNKALVETLKEFAEKHGLVLKASGFSYNENTMTKRVSFKVKSEDEQENQQAVVSEQENQQADMLAQTEGIPFSGHIIGTPIELAGATYKVAGLDPRARTHHWRIVETTPGGKKYRVSGEWLKNRLK